MNTECKPTWQNSQAYSSYCPILSVICPLCCWCSSRSVFPWCLACMISASWSFNLMNDYVKHHHEQFQKSIVRFRIQSKVLTTSKKADTVFIPGSACKPYWNWCGGTMFSTELWIVLLNSIIKSSSKELTKKNLMLHTSFVNETPTTK
jgi:hypothetical protein